LDKLSSNLSHNRPIGIPWLSCASRWIASCRISSFRAADVSDIPLSHRPAISNLDLNSYIETLTSSDREALNLQTAMLFPLGYIHAPPHSWEAKVAAAQRALDNFFSLSEFCRILRIFALMVASKMGWAVAGEIGYANVTSRRISPDDLTKRSEAAVARPARAGFASVCSCAFSFFFGIAEMC